MFLHTGIDDGSKKAPRFYEGQRTEYGNGHRLFLLNASNLRKVKPAEDGLVHVCAGVAFRHRCLVDRPPFSLNIALNKNASKANAMLNVQKSAGFDCVDVQLTAAAPAKTISSRVYWQLGSALPLLTLAVKLHVPCVLCQEPFTDTAGLCCSNKEKHFICWDCCFNYAKSAMQPARIGRSVDKEGNLICPLCKDCYHLQSVAAVANRASAGNDSDSASATGTRVFEALMQLRTDTVCRHSVDQALAEQNRAHQAELARIQQILDVDERKAAMVRIEVIDKILTLHCPRCTIAFADFDGCFALTCHHCHCGFCAWCLTDCGADAHAHVANCRENASRDVFGTKQAFTDHHRKRREEQVRKRLEKESEKIRDMALKLLEQDLKDLGIRIRMPAAAAAAAPAAPAQAGPAPQGLFRFFW